MARHGRSQGNWTQDGERGQGEIQSSLELRNGPLDATFHAIPVRLREMLMVGGERVESGVGLEVREWVVARLYWCWPDGRVGCSCREVLRDFQVNHINWRKVTPAYSA